MILGFFSDAHGNEIGFNQCLSYLQECADAIFFLGDAVGYIPVPNQIVDQLREHPIITSLMGNHDAIISNLLGYDEYLDDIYKVSLSKSRISKRNLDFINTLLPFKTVEVDEKKILLVHGSPNDPLRGYLYPDTSLEHLKYLDCDAVFLGHTHRSFVRRINNKLIVNVGSCGLSRDVGSVVTVTLYDTKLDTVKIVKLELDVNLVLKTYGHLIHESVKELFKRK